MNIDNIDDLSRIPCRSYIRHCVCLQAMADATGQKTEGFMKSPDRAVCVVFLPLISQDDPGFQLAIPDLDLLEDLCQAHLSKPLTKFSDKELARDEEDRLIVAIISDYRNIQQQKRSPQIQSLNALLGG